MNERVIAITVTYNDYDYLKRALDALRKQTYPLQKIIVVDNNSLPEMKEQVKTQEDDLVEVLWLPQNTGCAGGMEAGMNYTREKYSPDWYWLMDSDAFPEPDCLEKLLSHKNDTDNIGMLVPLIFGVERQEYQLYHHKKISKLLYRDIQKYSSYDEIPAGATPIDAGSVVGPLASKKAVDRLGIINSDFFIYGEDVEYTYRISRKFDELLVKEAGINHRDVSETGDQITTAWWKDYYAFRNRILFIKEFQKNTLHGVIGQGMFLLRIMKALLKNRLGHYNTNLKKYRRDLIIRSVKDGYADRKGKTVDPAAEKEKVKALES